MNDVHWARVAIIPLVGILIGFILGDLMLYGEIRPVVIERIYFTAVGYFAFWFMWRDKIYE